MKDDGKESTAVMEESVSREIELRRARGLPPHFCTAAVAKSHVMGKPMVKNSTEAKPEFQVRVKGMHHPLSIWVRRDQLCIGFQGKFTKVAKPVVQSWVPNLPPTKEDDESWLKRFISKGNKYVPVSLFGKQFELCVEDLNTALRKLNKNNP